MFEPIIGPWQKIGKCSACGDLLNYDCDGVCPECGSVDTILPVIARPVSELTGWGQKLFGEYSTRWELHPTSKVVQAPM